MRDEGNNIGYSSISVLTNNVDTSLYCLINLMIEKVQIILNAVIHRSK